jgi:uncharacterized protein (DUF433 family)
MDWRAFIDRDPGVLSGKPKIAGSRIAVELVIERLAAGWSFDELLAAYPHLNRDQLRACLRFAADCLTVNEIIDVPRSAA